VEEAKACGGAIRYVGSSLFENAEFNKATAEFANEHPKLGRRPRNVGFVAVPDQNTIGGERCRRI